MAFILKKLENHGGSGGGLKVFSYDAGTDTKALVKGANYFNEAYSLLSVGDRIHVHASDSDFDCHIQSKNASTKKIIIGAIDGFA